MLFISFSPPNHYSLSLSLHFDISVHTPSLSSSSSLPLISLPRRGLCCAVAAHRSDQDRWSRRISGLYSFLQETAWYCCWHDALLSGCPQVQQQHGPHSQPLNGVHDAHQASCPFMISAGYPSIFVLNGGSSTAKLDPNICLQTFTQPTVVLFI